MLVDLQLRIKNRSVISLIQRRVQELDDAR
jgi:hypothetical protein